MTGLDGITKAVRKAAAARTWSKGVLLAREGSVEAEPAEDEIECTVHVPERAVPYTAVLYLETEEWDCDCETRLDVCSHVVAAVLSLAHETEVAPKARAELVYRLGVQRGLLKVERLIKEPDQQLHALAEDPQRIASKRRNDIPLSLKPADVALESLLQKGSTLIDSLAQLEKLFAHLAEASVQFEQTQAMVVKARALPRGELVQEGQFILRIEQGPWKVIAPGVALSKGESIEIRPLGEVATFGQRWEKLPLRKSFPLSDAARLSQEVLPMYEGRFPIEVKVNLPKITGKGKPRLHFEVNMTERAISVLPRLVYGDPVRLRIEDGQAQALGEAVPTRDREAEHRLKEVLRSELNLVLDRPMVVDGADGAKLLQKVRSFEATSGRGYQTEDLPLVEARLDIEEDGRFHLSLEGEAEDGEVVQADAKAALHAFSQGHGLVPLMSGGWARLSQSWWKEHADEVALLLHLRNEEGKLPPFALPTLSEFAQSLDAPSPPGLDRLRPLFASFDILPEAILPEGLQAELRSYQLEGVKWLQFLQSTELGGLLADDMGLGKTLQTISVLKSPALVVVPTSVLSNWVRELQKFRPNLTVNAYHGPKRALHDADVVLTTYALLRADKAELGQTKWKMLVLDEAQAIKNPESLTARAAFSIPADFRLTLTGTPIENRLDELWSQMHFCNPGLLGGRSDFEGRFARPIESGDSQAAEKLRKRVKPFILRRLKRNVAKELPPRTEMVLTVELDQTEKAAYDGIKAATQKEVAERLSSGMSPLQVLEALLRLRQAACHTGLLPGRSAEGSSKIDLLVETLEEAVSEGHKALVFSQWTRLLDLTEPWLARHNLNFTRLDGSTRDRASVVEAFQADDGPPVMLLSLKAGGTGLNLTAADHVFLLDPWWNPAAEDQAADRAHRIGQDRPVMVYRLVAKDTVEERILALQAKKKALSDLAVADAHQAARVTQEDLLSLLDSD